MTNDKITIQPNLASFQGRDEDFIHVKVEDKILKGKHVCIAVGSRPVEPDFEGKEHCIDSNGFFELEELPPSMVFIGGGQIGVELAGMAHQLGTNATLITRSYGILRGFDRESANFVVEAMTKQKINVISDRKVVKVENDASTKTKRIVFNDDSSIECNEVVVTLGRRPNIDELNLGLLAVTTKSGMNEIVVDEQENTLEKNVQAIGDVTGKLQLTPVAIRAGRILSERLFGSLKHDMKDAKVDYDCVPSVVFSHPPQAVQKKTRRTKKAILRQSHDHAIHPTVTEEIVLFQPIKLFDGMDINNPKSNL